MNKGQRFAIQLTYIALLAVCVQSVGTRAATCRLMNKASGFIELTDTSDTCAADCKSNDRASCKCKSFGLPTKVSLAYIPLKTIDQKLISLY